MKPLTALLFASLIMWAAPGVTEEPPEFTVVQATPALLEELRGGGFVIYLRHGPTDTSRPDAPVIDLHDCSTQRPLTEEGRALATYVGEMMRQARIPIYQVIASPLCRASESARAAFEQFEVDEGLMYTARMTDAEKAPRLKATGALLSAPVPTGSNRVLVAHAPNIADLIDYFPTPEGVALVFRPREDGTFEYVASIPPALWAELLE